MSSNLKYYFNNYLFVTAILIFSLAIMSCARPTGLVISEPSGIPPAGGGNGDNGGGSGEEPDPITALKIEAFSKTAYTFLRVQCSDCHSNSKKRPNFAQEDVVAAYRIAREYISLEFPEASELIARSMNGHCDEENCMTDGTELRALVLKWVEVENANPDPNHQN